jgi:hypothetical protein
VTSDPLGERFHCGPQVADLCHDAGKAARIVAAMTVFFHDRSQVVVSVESRPADSGSGCDVREGHRFGVAN